MCFSSITLGMLQRSGSAVGCDVSHVVDLQALRAREAEMDSQYQRQQLLIWQYNSIRGLMGITEIISEQLFTCRAEPSCTRSLQHLLQQLMGIAARWQSQALVQLFTCAGQGLSSSRLAEQEQLPAGEAALEILQQVKVGLLGAAARCLAVYLPESAHSTRRGWGHWLGSTAGIQVCQFCSAIVQCLMVTTAISWAQLVIKKPLWSASSQSGNWNNSDNEPTHDHSTRLVHQQVTMLIASYVTALFSLLI